MKTKPTKNISESNVKEVQINTGRKFTTIFEKIFDELT